MKIRPCLASFWETPDSRTWIFHLQKDVKFHSGKPLRAEDVVYTFERLMKSEHLGISGYLFSITGVEAIDPFTVRVRTTRPASIMLNKIRLILIVPRGTSDQSLARHEDGTGPYVLTEWRKGVSVRMARNEKYWSKKPALKDVTFLLFRTPEQSIKDLVQGRSQFAQCNSAKIKEVFTKSKEWTHLRHDNIFMKYLSYDLSRDKTPYCDAKSNPFKNKLIRQAIHLGIDREALTEGLSSYAVPATQPVPPFIFGHNPGIPSPKHNPDQARDLLKRGGFENGFEVTLHARRIISAAAFNLKEQLKGIGITINVKILDDPELLNLLTKQDFSFFLSRMGSPTGDISDVLDNNFHSFDPMRHYGGYNFGRYSNRELDDAIEESAEIADTDRRLRYLHRTMSMIMDELIWIPLYFDQDIYALHRNFSWQPRNDSFILAAEIQN